MKRTELIKGLTDMEHKVIEVTPTEYKLDNGDVFEHQFDIDENITPEEFQTLLDNAKDVVIQTLTKVKTLTDGQTTEH